MAAIINEAKNTVLGLVNKVAVEYATRTTHLEKAYVVLNKAYASGSMPTVSDFSVEVLFTTFLAIVAVNLLIASLTKKGREFIGNAFAVVAAIILVIFLLAMFIGVPAWFCWGAWHLVKKVVLFIAALGPVKPLVAQASAALAPHLASVNAFLAPHLATIKPFYAVVAPYVNYVLSFF